MRSMRGAVVAIVTLGTLVFSSGTAAADARGDGKHSRDTLKLTAEVLQFEEVDVGTPGPSLGDMLVFSETLTERRREAGTSGVVCTVTETFPPYTDVTYHCVGTLSLRRGQITLQGLVDVQGEGDLGPWTVAITGGTGAYRGAGGEAVVRQFEDMTSTYKLRFVSDKKKAKKKKRSRGRH